MAPRMLASADMPMPAPEPAAAAVVSQPSAARCVVYYLALDDVID